MGFQLSEIKLLGLPRHRQMLLSRIKMRALVNLPEKLKKVLFYGRACYCPICESHIRKYERFGHVDKLWCPVCTSMRWHRLAWLFLQCQTNLFDQSPKAMLHIASEVALEPRLKQISSLNYLTGDLSDVRAMVKMDITNIPFPDDSFDIVLCSHVMEHVLDDRRALREFFRVLSSSGWAVFIVPIRMYKLTDEDPSITDIKERERRFGQYDHVRFYGRDFEERLKESGFHVTIVRAKDVINENQFEYMGIDKMEVFFYCEKCTEPESDDEMA